MIPGDQRYQILSLDGDGIKGLFSAAVRAAIEDDLATNVVDHFDPSTGTSTGGIIALSLASGMRAREIIEFYLSNGHRIFRKAWGLRWLQHWFCPNRVCVALAQPFKVRTRG